MLTASPENSSADLLVLPLAEGRALPTGFTAVDAALEGLLSRLLGTGFHGRFAETYQVQTLGRLRTSRVAMLGLGRAELVDGVRLRNALQIGLRVLFGEPAATLGLAWGGDAPAWSPADLAAAAVEAVVLAQFSEASHKSQPAKPRPVGRFQLSGFPKLDPKVLRHAEILAEATNLARELTNRPGLELPPAALAAEARRQAGRVGLECEVLDQRRLAKLGYGAILGVGGGSSRPPRLVVLRYRGAAAPRRAMPARQGRARRRPATSPVLALVGKGITFDTGGISIKPAADMQYMKGDMAGAAAVLGAMVAIARVRPKIDVIGILCAAENLISSTSMRPGDVIRSGSGKTIEVTNTDAEGRLVLADGVHHATTLGATHIVDVATLTGAQRIALGPVAALLMGSEPPFTELILWSAAQAGERLWAMPTFAEYETMLESSIADLDNSPGRDAGAITAGLFVRHFSAGLPWAHIDIAAPSWNRVASLKELPKGPTGFGVRTLARLTEALASEYKSDKISRN